MPQYQYQCAGCDKDFTLFLTLTEKEKAKVSCPACGGKKVAQVFTPFIARTSRKS
jgi:putative FmdB family regulatory protein